MSRKPRTRPRSSGTPVHRSANRPTSSSPRAPRSRADQTFWQCQACGALVDPMYGTGDDAWCPHCHTVGQVVGMDGQIPSPPLYGGWVRKQEEATERERTEKEIQQWLASRQTQKGERDMKRKKTHTGIFHCPACFIEYDLVAEESLKCDKCGGPLAEGSLDEVWADEDHSVNEDDD